MAESLRPPRSGAYPKACDNVDSTLLGSAAHPEIMNPVDMASSSACERVDEIRVTASVDCSIYESAGTQSAMGFFRDHAIPAERATGRRGAYRGVPMTADHAGPASGSCGSRRERSPASAAITRGWVGDNDAVSVEFN